MAASEQKLNKIFDQNVQITGNLTVDGDLVGFSGDNFYLDGITKSGNTLTFSVNGATNQTYTFGSNAFTSYTDHSTQGYLTSLPAHSHPYLSNDSDSEQTVGSKINYFNSGGLRMNMDPRWNEGGYDGDNGNLHIWSTKANGGNYGRAGLALYNGSAYQYLTTKGGQNAIYHNNNEIITSSSIGSQSVSYATSAGNAGTIDGVDSSRIIYGNNTSGTNEGNYSDWNSLSKTGFYSHSNASNKWSSADNWSSVLHFKLYDDNNNYASQLGFNTYDNRIYARTNNAGTWTSWDEIITTGNKDSYTYPPATHNHDGIYVKEGGASFNGEYPVVVRTSADVIYSDANIRFRGSDSRLTVDGSIETPRLKVTGSNNGNFGYASFSWSGSSGYPTLFSDHPDRWVMHVNPHIVWAQNGQRGFTGSTKGSMIRFEGNLGASTYWDAGVLTGISSGGDHWGIMREGTWAFYADPSANLHANSSMRAPIFYDSNDTGYYVDPASTSNMNVVTSANDTVDDEVLFAITDYDTSESIRRKFNGGSGLTKIDDPDAPASGVFKVQGSFNTTFGPYMPMDDETEVIFECWAKHDSGSDTAGLFYCGSNFYDGSKGYYGNTQRYWGASSDAQDANDTGWRHIKGAFKGSTIRAALSDASYFQFIALFNYQSNGNATRFCGFKFYRSKKTISSLWVKRGVNDTGFQSTEAATAHQVISNNADVFPKSLLEMPAHSGVMKFRTNTHWESNPGIDFIGTGGEFRMSSDTGNLNLRVDGWLLAHDYVQSLNQVYGTIYYDQDNTGYYLDPSSTTSGNLRGNLRFGDYGVGVTGTYTSTRLQTIFNMGPAYQIAVDGSSASGAYGLYWSHQNAGSLGGANNLASHGILIIENGSWKGAWGGGSLRTPGDVRAPIFYDYNNTGYYCNPASTSLLSELNANHFGINNSNDSTRDGISLYGGYSSGEPTYGLLFTGTSLGTHGAVTGSWATYFTMNNDNSRGWIFRRVGSGNAASISGGGTASFNGDVIAYYSDMRLKTKLGDIKDPIGKIQALNGFYYEPNEVAESYGYEKETRVGLSAQEVEAVLPEIVTDAPIGDGYKTVDYAKLVPVLVEAIKEQQKQIDELKKLINP